MGLRTRGEIYEIEVTVLLLASEKDDSPILRIANCVFRKAELPRPFDDLSQRRRLGESGDHGLRRDGSSDADFREANFEGAILDAEANQQGWKRDL